MTKPAIDISRQSSADQLKILRKARLAMMLGLAVLELFVGYDLWSLDSGRVTSVDTFLPTGMVYDLAGFWPAILALPVLAIILWFVATRRIRGMEGSAK